MTSIFDQTRTQDAAVVVAEPVPMALHPRVTDEELVDTFARLLGRSELPTETWRAIGNVDALDRTVKSTVDWMTRATVYRSPVPELPQIPHEEVIIEGSKTRVLVPAAGTRAVFDACLAAFHGGLTPSQIQTQWNTARRQVLSRTQGAPGFRRMMR